MKRFRPSGGQIARALLLFAAALAVGRLLRPVTEVEGLPSNALIPTAATYDSSMAYLHGDLSAAASRLLPPRPAGADRSRVVALLRAADWRACEDLGRQFRELQRHLAPIRSCSSGPSPTTFPRSSTG